MTTERTQTCSESMGSASASALVWLLNDVTFEVGTGRLTGFVGGNGAGKTTTMRIILGVLAADRRRRDTRRGTAGPPGSPTLRLHAGGARPVPEDEGRRTAHLPRAAARSEPGRPRLATPRGSWTGSGSASAPTTRSRACRSATSSARRSRQRSCTTPRCSFSTSRSPGSTRWRLRRCWECCRRRRVPGCRCSSPVHQLELVERLCDDLVIIANGEIRAAGARDQLRAANAAIAVRDPHPRATRRGCDPSPA